MTGGGVLSERRRKSRRAHSRHRRDGTNLPRPECHRIVHPRKAGILMNQDIRIIMQNKSSVWNSQCRPIGHECASAVVMCFRHPAAPEPSRELAKSSVSRLKVHNLAEQACSLEFLCQIPDIGEPLLELGIRHAAMRIEDACSLWTATVHHGEASGEPLMSPHQRGHCQRCVGGITCAKVNLQCHIAPGVNRGESVGCGHAIGKQRQPVSLMEMHIKDSLQVCSSAEYRMSPSWAAKHSFLSQDTG